MRFKVNGGIEAVRRDVVDASDQVGVLEYLKLLQQLGPDASDLDIGMLLTSRGIYFNRAIPGMDYVITYAVIPTDEPGEPTLIVVRSIHPFDGRWLR